MKSPELAWNLAQARSPDGTMRTAWESSGAGGRRYRVIPLLSRMAPGSDVIRPTYQPYRRVAAADGLAGAGVEWLALQCPSPDAGLSMRICEDYESGCLAGERAKAEADAAEARRQAVTIAAGPLRGGDADLSLAVVRALAVRREAIGAPGSPAARCGWRFALGGHVGGLREERLDALRDFDDYVSGHAARRELMAGRFPAPEPAG